MKKLRDIADIRAGYAFRERLEYDAKGNVRVVQLTDLTLQNRVAFETAIRVRLLAETEPYALHKGDLVFRSRGLRTTAALMEEDAADVILAAPFFRIRIKDTALVNPGYLTWYIASRPAQRFFTERQTGTSVNMVTAQELSELPVEVPPLAVQEQIAEIAKLSEREQQIETELNEKRKMYREAVLLRQAHIEGDSHD